MRGDCIKMSEGVDRNPRICRVGAEFCVVVQGLDCCLFGSNPDLFQAFTSYTAAKHSSLLKPSMLLIFTSPSKHRHPGTLMNPPPVDPAPTGHPSVCVDLKRKVEQAIDKHRWSSPHCLYAFRKRNTSASFCFDLLISLKIGVGLSASFPGAMLVFLGPS